MNMNTLAKANKLVDEMGEHNSQIDKLKGIDRDAEVIIISTNHELYDEILNQVVDYDKRNPGNTASVVIKGETKTAMMDTLISIENKSLRKCIDELESL